MWNKLFGYNECDFSIFIMDTMKTISKTFDIT